MSKQTGIPAALVDILRHVAKIETGMDDRELDEALKPDERTKASYIPEEYLNEFFDELLECRGKALAEQFIERNGILSEAFPWAMTKSGSKFWIKVEKETIENFNYHHGINEENQPNTKKAKASTGSTANALDVMIKEAESRGFGIGVSTKFGIIRDRKTPESSPIECELMSNGDFFYYNIKVFKNGKWIKPGIKPKKGYNDHELSSTSDAMMESAIHDFIQSLIKQQK